MSAVGEDPRWDAAVNRAAWSQGNADYTAEHKAWGHILMTLSSATRIARGPRQP